MFPLNWNIPFIRKNGSRTTLGAITGDIAGIEEDVSELTDKTDSLWDNMLENGAVNLMPNKGTTQTINDIAFTVNPDRTITANGTNSSTSELVYEIDAVSDNYVLPAGSYKLTGCPSNGGDNTWRLQAYKTDATTIVAIDSGSGETFTLTEPTQLVVKIRIGGRVGSGTLTNLTFKPMISAQPLNLSYDDYVPYAMTNRELTEEINGGFVLINPRYKVAEVTADGTKTNATLLAELCSATSTAIGQIASNLRIKLDCISISSYDTMIIPAQSLLTNTNTVNEISAFVIHTTGSGMKIETVIGRSSNSRFREVEINVINGNITPTNGDSVVPTSGNKFTVYCELYRSVS